MSDDLWTTASRDVEQEDLERRLTAARLAATPLWPFLAAATSHRDFENRKALSADRIERVALVAADHDPVLFGVVHTSLLDGFTKDFTLVHTARLEQRKAANSKEVQDATLERLRASDDKDALTRTRDQNNRLLKQILPSGTAEEIKGQNRVIDERLKALGRKTAVKPAPRVAGEGARVRDPYNSGIKKDVPAGAVATPTQGYATFGGVTYDWAVEGFEGDWRLEGDWTEQVTASRRRTIAAFPANEDDVADAEKGHEDPKTCSVCGDKIAKNPEGDGYHHDNGEKHDHEAKAASSDSKESSHRVRRTASTYCPAHGVYVGEGNQEQHDHCATEQRETKDSARRIAFATPAEEYDAGMAEGVADKAAGVEPKVDLTTLNPGSGSWDAHGAHPSYWSQGYVAGYQGTTARRRTAAARCSRCGRPGVPYEYNGVVFDGLTPFEGERLCPICTGARLSEIAAEPVGPFGVPASEYISPMSPSRWGSRRTAGENPFPPKKDAAPADPAEPAADPLPVRLFDTRDDTTLGWYASEENARADLAKYPQAEWFATADTEDTSAAPAEQTPPATASRRPFGRSTASRRTAANSEVTWEYDAERWVTALGNDQGGWSVGATDGWLPYSHPTADVKTLMDAERFAKDIFAKWDNDEVSAGRPAKGFDPTSGSQEILAGRARTAATQHLVCGRCGNEWSTQAQYNIACPNCGAEESVRRAASRRQAANPYQPTENPYINDPPAQPGMPDDQFDGPTDNPLTHTQTPSTTRPRQQPNGAPADFSVTPGVNQRMAPTTEDTKPTTTTQGFASKSTPHLVQERA